jgi:hypothetical protein
MLFMIFAFLIGFGLIGLAIVRLSRGNGGEEGGADEDRWWRGGGGPPRPRPRGPEPSWWPEFEREFRAYVSAHGGHRSASGIGS